MWATLFVKTALLLAVLTVPSAAQEWPAKPVRLVAPFAAGGASDTLGRMVAESLTKALGQQFFVDNRGGAAGMIGSAAVATADPRRLHIVGFRERIPMSLRRRSTAPRPTTG